MLKRKVRLLLLVVLVVLALAFSGIIVVLPWLQDAHHDFRAGTHIAFLAAALGTYYHHNHNELPESLDVIEAMGLYGSLPYEGPCGAPIYLPVKTSESHDGVIIAIDAPPPGGRKRNYVIVGDRTGYTAEFSEMAQLLAEDDVRRRAIGESRLWQDVKWQERQ